MNNRRLGPSCLNYAGAHKVNDLCSRKHECITFINVPFYCLTDFPLIVQRNLHVICRAQYCRIHNSASFIVSWKSWLNEAVIGRTLGIISPFLSSFNCARPLHVLFLIREWLREFTLWIAWRHTDEAFRRLEIMTLSTVQKGHDRCVIEFWLYRLAALTRVFKN